ncbi:CoA pyrophosphatase [Peribacillus cavernae]|uniref:CoA pyrophosphatase n=1 Tax=Peribacillus cavernae TaxID=1674310 RepID=A0A433HRS3_9BACI|nr:CoA pyrophosphatase [Peribacillus cavernae]MDQ0218764.1 8-oxo-dGTP pyrophosphatase MutT (NUDIX family) [Peribacillus cavernae]RUQ30975.1 CoA pyrophosphatase [Peribacillus cavernae]
MNMEHIISKLDQHTPTILGSENFLKYAVLLPLIRKDSEIHVLFEVRSLKLRRQPGEICFPGGRIDSEDTDERGAAIRETIEELGIKGEEISDVYPIDYLISGFGMIVYPYVGFIDCPERIKPNPTEVGDIFTVPLSYFIETEPEVYHVSFKAEPEENFPLNLLVGGENYNWQSRQMDEFFYIYENRVIWGLTARILSHFVEILR